MASTRRVPTRPAPSGRAPLQVLPRARQRFARVHPRRSLVLREPVLDRRPCLRSTRGCWRSSSRTRRMPRPPARPPPTDLAPASPSTARWPHMRSSMSALAVGPATRAVALVDRHGPAEAVDGRAHVRLGVAAGPPPRASLEGRGSRRAQWTQGSMGASSTACRASARPCRAMRSGRIHGPSRTWRARAERRLAPRRCRSRPRRSRAPDPGGDLTREDRASIGAPAQKVLAMKPRAGHLGVGLAGVRPERRRPSRSDRRRARGCPRAGSRRASIPMRRTHASALPSYRLASLRPSSAAAS